MTEALIAELSKIGALQGHFPNLVRWQYKNTDKLMTQVAQELNVDGVIEGSIIREGDQVRINVQLIHGPTDNHLWTESYLRELRGILGLQSDVARAIADRSTDPTDRPGIRATIRYAEGRPGSTRCLSSWTLLLERGSTRGPREGARVL